MPDTAQPLYVITELGLDLPDPPPRDQPHPERTPVGPFPTREAADDWASGLARQHGGGEWEIAPLRSPRTEATCRECGDGKHRNCDGQAWDTEADGPTECTCPDIEHRPSPSPTTEVRPASSDVRPDFGDLLIGVAHDLDDIRLCIVCGQDSTWAGLYVHDDGTVTAAAWCDAPACEADRTADVASLSLPINHLPGLRRASQQTGGVR